MMQTRDSSAADRLTELDPKGFAGKEQETHYKYTEKIQGWISPVC